VEYTFLSATVLLILITDPLGNIPLFISCLRGVAPKRRTVVILREVAIAFAILLVFMVVGDRFLRMMSLTDQSLRIGGGIVLFLIALTVTMLVCAVVLMLAERIQAWLGERAMMAFERLMGLVLVAISVEMMLGGIRSFVHQL
jgi:small neutral amino acid transporter SnatA (MarC family)